MQRKITAEERQTLLDNPELVMFDPYSGRTSYAISWLKLLALPSAVTVLFLAFGFIFPDIIESHPNLFAGIGFILIIAACAFIPFKWYIEADLEYKRSVKTHYIKDLRRLLPIELTCSTAYIQSVIYEKCEGSWIYNGKEELFSYSGFVNIFRFIPQTEVAMVHGKGFMAFIKRDPRTESFYEQSDPQRSPESTS